LKPLPQRALASKTKWDKTL